MNHFVWIGVIVWGLIMMGFGIATAGPAGAGVPPDVAPQDVVFLVAGGLISCLLGTVGLLGLAGWMRPFHGDKESAA